MRPLKVGVFHSSRSLLGSKSSGAGIYEVSLAEILKQVATKLPIQFVHYVPGKSRFIHKSWNSPQQVVQEIRSGFWEQQLSRAPYSMSAHALEKLHLLKTRNRFQRDNVDLVFFSSPSPVSLRLGDIPYVLTIWDTGHRDLPGFTEVWGRRTWLNRELIYTIGVGRASFVVVDSEATGAKLSQYYALPRERWSAIGLLPSVPKVVQSELELDFPYIVYPSVHWAHKNHVTLLEAFAKLSREFPTLKLVLSGDRLSTKNGLLQLSRDLGLHERVVDLGFLPRERLISLIHGAQVLVMPSLLGPTNIPPLEALQLGVPAVVSDVHDFGEETNKLLVRVPALDPSLWAEALRKILTDGPRKSPVKSSEFDATHALCRMFESLSDQIAILHKFRGSSK